MKPSGILPFHNVDEKASIPLLYRSSSETTLTSAPPSDASDQGSDHGTLENTRKLAHSRTGKGGRPRPSSCYMPFCVRPGRRMYTILAAVMTALLLLIRRRAIDSHKSPFPADEIPSWDPQLPSAPQWQFWRPEQTAYNGQADIPNLVHFVRQINRDEQYVARGPFHVEFRHLLAYYSAYHYMRPDRIYFWTDTPQDMLNDARLHGDIFTRALFRIPNLEIRPVTFPNTSRSGLPLVHYAHRSDFIRTRVMAKFGGVYLDDDAWVLRDLTPLRRAGFDNVWSLDEGARIAQAAWLCKPLNPLMVAFARLQDVVFNGEWLRASGDLVTALMQHFARLPGDRSSLVLEKDAFFPGHWGGDNLNMYYEVHDDDVATFHEPEAPSTGQDGTQSFQYDFDWGWRRDWRRSWIIHGWSNELRIRNAYHLFKEFKNFTPAFVLSRRANIARALYPVLRRMLDSGFLHLDADQLAAPPPL